MLRLYFEFRPSNSHSQDFQGLAFQAFVPFAESATNGTILVDVASKALKAKHLRNVAEPN